MFGLVAKSSVPVIVKGLPVFVKVNKLAFVKFPTPDNRLEIVSPVTALEALLVTVMPTVPQTIL